jgi:predicted amidohydrolase
LTAPLRITAVQFAPRLADLAGNLAAMEAAIRDAPGRLVVFPECATSGYAFESREEVLRLAEPVPGPATATLARACAAAGAVAVAGLLERDGDRVFNAAVVVGPEGVLGRYRKMHIPWIGADRFVEPGDLGFVVVPTPLARLGLLICYDLSFPEAARVLKLRGAQILIVPTNWPEQARVSAEHSPPVRAQENHIHVVACNRSGEEGGFRFRGGSSIHDCHGLRLAGAGREVSAITADLVFEAGRYELDRIADRRPGWYAPIAAL